MKRSTLWSAHIVAVLITLTALSSVGIVPAAAQTTLRVTIATDPTHPNNIALAEFAKAVATRTSGQIKIEVFPNSALGNPAETTEQVVRLGAIEMAVLAPSNIDKYARAYAMSMVPYVFDDIAHAHRVLDGPVSDWLKEEGEKAGFTLLAFNFEFGFRVISNSRRPINVPDDVKGLKIGVPPENQSRASIEALGATAQVVPFPEVYLALANKLVDGMERPLSAMYSQKWHEVQSHVAATNQIYTHQFLIINSKVWNKIDPASQRIMIEEGKRAGIMARRLVAENEPKIIADMERTGVKFTYPPIEPFRAKMGPAYASLKAWIGDKDWDKFMAYVEAGRKKP